jgi:hypothetical protein
MPRSENRFRHHLFEAHAALSRGDPVSAVEPLKSARSSISSVQSAAKRAAARRLVDRALTMARAATLTTARS